MAVQPGLCGTRSKTLKTGFLTTRLNLPNVLEIQVEDTVQTLIRFFTVCNSVCICWWPYADPERGGGVTGGPYIFQGMGLKIASDAPWSAHGGLTLVNYFEVWSD